MHGTVQSGTKGKQAQALAIKRSQEEPSGKEAPPPPKGRDAEETRKRAIRDIGVGRKRRSAKKK